jgi:hypothetical protein
MYNPGICLEGPREAANKKKPLRIAGIPAEI